MKPPASLVNATLIFLFLHPSASADTNLIVNGGFEEGTPADFGPLDGWNASGNPFGYGATPPSYTATEGTRIAVLNGGSNVFNGVLSQSFATVPGRTYTLALDLGITGIAGRKQRLLVAVDGGGRLLSQAADVTATGSAAAWSARSWNFTADSSVTMLTLADGSSQLSGALTGAADMMIDHVRVSGPEVAVLTLDSRPVSGVALQPDRPDIDGSSGGVTPFTLNCRSGEKVTITAPLFHQGMRLSGWELDGEPSGGGTTIAVTPSGDSGLTAVYTANALPLAQDDAYAADADGVLDVAAPGVLANDLDADGDTLTATLVEAALHGSVLINADGSFAYTPPSGFEGTDGFRYAVTDGGSDPVVASVTITVRPEDRGILKNGSFENGQVSSGGIATIEEWSAAGKVFGYVADASYTARDGSRILVFNGGGNTYDGSLAQTFPTVPGTAYRLDFDGGILASASRKQRLRMQLAGIVTLADRTEEFATTGGSARWRSIDQSFIADGPTTTLTFQDASSTLPSTQTSSSDLLLDHARITLLGATFRIRISSVSDVDAPISVNAADFNGASDGTGTFERTYIDGTTVVLVATGAIGENRFAHWLLDGEIQGTSPSVSLLADRDQSWTAVYRRITAPVVNADHYSAMEDERLVIPAPGVLGNDLDSGSAVVELLIEDQPEHGAATLQTDGSFSYLPDADFHGTDQFTYRATNEAGISDSAAVTIHVQPVNDAPRASSMDIITAEDQPVSVPLAADDVDGDPLVYSIQPPVHGMLSGIAPDLVYIPDPDFHGSDQFTWSVSDGELDSQLATIRIEVTSINDSPVAQAASYSVVAGELIDIILSGSDPDGDELAYVISGHPTSGMLEGAPPNLTYKAAADGIGPDEFTFTVSDGSAVSEPATVRIEVGAPPIPVFADWLSESGIDDGASGDPDGDRIATLLEYALGTDPLQAEAGAFLPVATIEDSASEDDAGSGKRVVFRFRRADRAERDPTVATVVEWSDSPVGGWRPVDANDGAVTTVHDDAEGSGIDRVDVTMPRPPGGRFFARLRVIHTDE